MSDNLQAAKAMRGVIPYLALEDARRAVAFYQKAFGAELIGEVALMPNDTRVANASLAINGGVLMLSDTFPEMEVPATTPNAGVTMQLVVDDGDAWWTRAVEAGCAVVTPLAMQFWGDRYGQLRDPFGVAWAMNEPSAENRAKAAQW